MPVANNARPTAERYGTKDLGRIKVLIGLSGGVPGTEGSAKSSFRMKAVADYTMADIV
jgi:hypothetical protein